MPEAAVVAEAAAAEAAEAAAAEAAEVAAVVAVAVAAEVAAAVSYGAFAESASLEHFSVMLSLALTT
jgi:hypothetical protein